MQPSNFIDVPLARHVFGHFHPSSGALDLVVRRVVFPIFVLLGGYPGGCCVVRVCGVVGTAREVYVYSLVMCNCHGLFFTTRSSVRRPLLMSSTKGNRNI
jgi:hypothetical protein